jgi:hypothetical protein
MVKLSSEALGAPKQEKSKLRQKVSAGFVALSLLASTGCIKYEGNPDGPRVAITGDSITGQSTDAIKARLGSTFQLAIDAQYGQTMGDMLPEVEALATNPYGVPDAIILELGTKDALNENPDWRESFDQMIASVADIDCVVLVGVNRQTDAYYGNNTIVSDGLNAAMDELVASNPEKYKKIDWLEDYDIEAEISAQSAVGPHNFTMFVVNEDYPDGIWFADRIHLSQQEGYGTLAIIYDQALRDKCFPELQE